MILSKKEEKPQREGGCFDGMRSHSLSFSLKKTSFLSFRKTIILLTFQFVAVLGKYESEKRHKASPEFSVLTS